MPNVPARDLASALTMVRQHPAKMALPRTTGLDPDGQLALEEKQVGSAHWRVAADIVTADQ